LFLAGTATAVAGAVTGCGSGADVFGLRRTVKIAVSWSAEELQAFRAVLDGLGSLDYPIELIPLGDDIGAAFGPRTPRRPDIVMLPQPGLVRTLQTQLAPLPPKAKAKASQLHAEGVWRDLLPDTKRGPYGLPFKMAHKSTIWYRKPVFAALGLRAPTTWRGWLKLNAHLVEKRIPPLALAAGDVWMLTDLFENVLLGCSPDTYHKLANDRSGWTATAVAQALRLLGRMLTAPGTLAGGVNRSRVQQFPDAVVEVFGHKKAAMVIAPDFAELVVRRFARDPDDVGVFTFPRIDGDDQDSVGPTVPLPPVIVGGDIAVLPKPADANALDLVTRLAGKDAALPWIKKYGGFLAANREAPTTSYSPALHQLAEQLDDGRRSVAFDLSDQLGTLGGNEGLGRVLQEFLVAVGKHGSASVPHAADTAVARLVRLEQLEKLRR
jgi:alpha-glucoside transport system substrate-binding protein